MPVVGREDRGLLIAPILITLILSVRVSLWAATEIAQWAKDVFFKYLIQILRTQENPGMLICAYNPNDLVGRWQGEICGSLEISVA